MSSLLQIAIEAEERTTKAVSEAAGHIVELKRLSMNVSATIDAMIGQIEAAEYDSQKAVLGIGALRKLKEMVSGNSSDEEPENLPKVQKKSKGKRVEVKRSVRNISSYDSQDKIDLILDWASNKSSFDTTYVEEMQEKLDEYGELTDAQDGGLDNIIKRFRIS